MIFIFALLITVFYLIGGQTEKSVRRYGVPVSVLTMTLMTSKDKKQKLRSIGLLTMIGVLSMGYGESSWLRKLLGGNDKLTRIVYGLILAIPFCFVRIHYAYFLILPAMFSIRAGKICSFKVGEKDFDILIEDIFRAMGIFSCALIMLQ